MDFWCCGGGKVVVCDAVVECFWVLYARALMWAFLKMGRRVEGWYPCWVMCWKKCCDSYLIAFLLEKQRSSRMLPKIRP